VEGQAAASADEPTQLSLIRRRGSGSRAGLRPLESGNFAENLTVTQGDPTDHALATIVSILEHPEVRAVHREPGTAVDQDMPLAPDQVEADGYCKVGPGSIAAMRFKWTARRAESGDYFVDESMGDHANPLVAGPMTAEAAIRFVDDREREARTRFEEIRNEIMDRAAAAALTRDGGE
jgi:hypothetical protein